MSVSSITAVSTVEAARHLAAFSNGSDLYGLWSSVSPRAPCCRLLTWRRHTDPTSSDVRADLVQNYETPSAVVRFDGALVVAYCTSLSAVSPIWVAAFNLSTGVSIMAPVRVGTGSCPILFNLPGAMGVARLSLTYIAKEVPRIRESSDGGRTWSGERPVLNAKVQRTVTLAAAPFDDAHVSLMQLGEDARTISELSSISRTRPLVGIVPHPTQQGKFYAVESTHRQVTSVEQLSDNERGYLSVLPDGRILTSSRVRVGSADAYGDVMLVDGTSTVPAISASAVAPTGAAAGAEAVTVLADAAGAGSVLAALFGASNAAVADVVSGNGYGYFAGYTDQSVDGALAVLQLSDNTVARPITGIPCRCLDLKQGLLVVATTESGVEKVRFYAENGLTPTLLTTHILPARANVLSLVMTDATHGLLYVSAVDRLNIYRISGLTDPIQLVSSFRVLTLGSFFQHQDIAITGGGYIVAAVGNGGVAVFNKFGETVAQIPLSGIAVPVWTPGKATLLNDLVRPTPGSFYAAQRKYFKCTVAGTTNNYEPAWAPAPANVPDNNITWTEVGPFEGVAVGVALDEVRKRILVSGLAGGPSGNAGRVWMIDAKAVMP